MDKNKLLYFLDVYINEISIQDIELMYGKGTRIKFISVNETLSSSNPFLVFDIRVIFGEKFDEDLLDISLIELLIKKFINQFDTKYGIVTIVKWDV